ncbi:hypothetical protein, partial [Methylobacterium sp. WL30]|uniref:hypothetical protein n=1 Tax=Methylobacterium sp. WL30 TaxID=2603895 RepID=UPI001AEE1044
IMSLKYVADTNPLNRDHVKQEAITNHIETTTTTVLAFSFADTIKEENINAPRTISHCFGDSFLKAFRIRRIAEIFIQPPGPKKSLALSTGTCDFAAK